jgi:hypothetical protein
VAARFYPTNTASPISPALDASWENSSTLQRRTVSPDPADYDFGTTNLSSASGVANEDTALYQFIYGPLAAQTISGTLKGQFFAREASGASDARGQMVARVLSSDGSTVRGTLYGSDTGALSSEFVVTTNGSEATNRKIPRGGAAAVSSVAAQAGDYLVVEVGFRNHGTNASVARVSLGADPATADAPEDETSLVGGYRSWFEFSHNVGLLKQGSDSGSSTDALGRLRLPASDSGSGSDGNAALSANLVRSDSAAGVEALGNRAMVLTDTGAGADVANVQIVVEAVNPFPILPLTLAEALKRHHTPVARVTFLGLHLDDVLHVVTDALDGSVSSERGRNINRSGQLALPNVDGLLTPQAGLVAANRLVRIERGVLIGDVPQYSELLTGVLDEWSIKEGSAEVSFTVWSRLHLAARDFSEPFTVAAGVPLDEAVRMIAELAGLGLSDELYELDSGGATLATARTFDQGSMLDAMIALAFEHGLDLYDDGHGRMVMHPFVDPATADVAWEFAPGELSTLLDATRSGRAVQAFNRAVVIGKWPIRAEARVTNPDDPLYNPEDGSGPLGDRPRTFRYPDIDDQAAATAVAHHLLREGALYEEAIQLGAVAIPLLGSRDVVRISAAGADDRYLLDQLSIPLLKGAMSLSTRRVRSLLL